MPAKKNDFKPANEVSDVLETAEIVRAAATLLRMTVGIVSFSESIAKAKVFEDSELKDINSAYDTLFSCFNKCYASFMGRYSALSASEAGNSPKNVPVKS